MTASTPSHTTAFRRTTAVTRTEGRLLAREWAAMVFAFVFPPVTLLVLAGSFGDTPDPEFGGALPADFYITGYAAVPLGAMALIGLPVVLAGYRPSARPGAPRRWACSRSSPCGCCAAADRRPRS